MFKVTLLQNGLRLTLLNPFAIKTVRFSGEILRWREQLFRSSSMAEHSAVNRRVVGSSPTCGATKSKKGEAGLASPFSLWLVDSLMFWVYILERIQEGTFYIGQTADLDARLKTP